LTLNDFLEAKQYVPPSVQQQPQDENEFQMGTLLKLAKHLKKTEQF